MDIVCNIDSNYVKYCVVMFTSLFDNNKPGSIDAHIISEGLSEEDKELIRTSLAHYDNRIHFYDVGNEILRDCPLKEDSYISISTYYRVFLPAILPQYISKVIYLDCDLIVVSSIEELWNIDITDYGIAAVEDMWSYPNFPPYEPLEAYRRLEIDPKYSYFNAGVMMINLDYWREHHIMEQCIQYIQTYPERLHLNDQDVLNAILYNQKLFIPFKWNMQEGFYRRKRHIRQEVWKELDTLLPYPAIIHYVGKMKPWHRKSEHPFTEEYRYYMRKTRWRNECPRTKWQTKIWRGIQKIGYALKIDRPRFRQFKKVKLVNKH